MPALTDSTLPGITPEIEYTEAMHTPKPFPFRQLKQGYTPAYIGDRPVQVDPNLLEVESFSEISGDIERGRLESQKELEYLASHPDPSTISQYIHTGGPLLTAYDPGFSGLIGRGPSVLPQTQFTVKGPLQRAATASTQTATTGIIPNIATRRAASPAQAARGTVPGQMDLSKLQEMLAGGADKEEGLRRIPPQQQMVFQERPMGIEGMQRRTSRRLPQLAYGSSGLSQQASSSAPTTGSYQNTIR